MDEFIYIHDAKLEVCCLALHLSIKHKPSLEFIRHRTEAQVRMMEGTKFIKINYCPFCGERINIIDER